MFTTSTWTVKPNREFKEYNERYFTVMFDDSKESPDCYEWCEKCPCSDMCERYGWEYSCGIWEDMMGEDLQKIEKNGSRKTSFFYQKITLPH